MDPETTPEKALQQYEQARESSDQVGGGRSRSLRIRPLGGWLALVIESGKLVGLVMTVGAVATVKPLYVSIVAFGQNTLSKYVMLQSLLNTLVNDETNAGMASKARNATTRAMAQLLAGLRYRLRW
tara:strand:+ start:159 stop:536 length:378 start_codon:yes stop_codon:yes gene_type:complete